MQPPVDLNPGWMRECCRQSDDLFDGAGVAKQSATECADQFNQNAGFVTIGDAVFHAALDPLDLEQPTRLHSPERLTGHGRGQCERFPQL